MSIWLQDIYVKNGHCMKLFNKYLKSSRNNKSSQFEQTSLSVDAESLQNEYIVSLKPESLLMNFWIGKFIQKVTGNDG